MYTFSKRHMGLAALLLVAVTPARAEWQYEFTPYGWATDIITTAGSGKGDAATAEMDINDVLDMVDASWMSMFEARNGNWSIMNDIVYMKLSDSMSASGSHTGRLGFATVKTELETDIQFEQGTADLMLGYTPDNTQTTVYGGLRYNYLSAKVDVQLDITTDIGKRERFERSRSRSLSASGSRDEDWIDPVIGVRHIMPFTDKLDGFVQVDVGGGVDSEFSSLATAGVTYAFSDDVNLRLAYRYARIDKDDNELLFDQTADGVLLGVGFKF